MEIASLEPVRWGEKGLGIEAHDIRIDEENAHGAATSIRSSSQQDGFQADPHVEDSAGRKVDFSVLFPLVLGLLVFQLDRMNLPSALTGGFAKDIKIDQNTVNLGNQLMFMGIVVFEIPCNMALQRLGPRKWISAQVFVFGTIATLQVFVKGRTGFLVARLFLGFAEAGYIPGAAYTLSNWYTRQKLAKRMSIFFFGMFGGNAISPLLASGILELHGKRGMKGWQWLFMLEGLLTILIALAMLFSLHGSPQAPLPLIGPGIVHFAGEERQALEASLHTDDPDKSFDQSINFRLVWKTISHYRRWPHFVSTFVVFSTWSPLITYTPSIMMSLGFKRLGANALAAVGASLALPVVFIFGVISDRTNRRGASVIVAQICYLIVLIVARAVHPRVGKWARFGLWTSVNAFAVGYHPVHNTWVQLNRHEARERSIAIAMWVMSAISGLMVGTQYFRADDTPFYENGLRTMIIMVSVGIIFAVLQLSIYTLQNRRASPLVHALINTVGDTLWRESRWSWDATSQYLPTALRMLHYWIAATMLHGICIHSRYSHIVATIVSVIPTNTTP